MGTENIQTYKNVCKLFSRSRRGQSVRCCHFCPQKDTCQSTWGECLNSPDKCGYYAKSKKIDGDFAYCKNIKCLPPDSEAVDEP